MKRSTQVALLVMGVAGVGATGYAFTSPRPADCIPAGTQTPSPAAAAAAVDKESKLAPCPPRNTWRSSPGYYRSHWHSSSPSHWSAPIFGRRQTTTGPTGTSPTSLGFTRPGSTSTTTSRPSTTTSRPSTTTTSRTGFGTIGRTFSTSTS